MDLKKEFDTKLFYLNWHYLIFLQKMLVYAMDVIKSPFFACSTGVPHFSIPGPLLLSLYSNNLPIVRQNVNIQMYADDLWKAYLTPSESRMVNHTFYSIVKISMHDVFKRTSE